MKSEWIRLEDIDVGERLRPINEAHVSALAASIREIGLQTPVTVMSCARDDDGRLVLLAGAHRIAALRLLGEEGVQCIVVPEDPDFAELWEIDENFARAELTDAQRADHHVRREAILIRRGVVKDAPKGGRPKNLDNLSKYSEQAAAAFGVDERTIRRDLRRGKNIEPSVLAAVAGTDLDKGTVLDQLASTPREQQAAKIIEIRDRQEADKLNRYADKAVSRSNAEEASEIIYRNLDLDQIDDLMARLASVTMKDFLGAMSMARAA